MNSLTRSEYYAWTPAACLRIQGEDAATFLQGQFTNDLQKVVPGDAVYGLWLNQKGKVLADSFVIRIAAQEFGIVSYFSSAAVIKERLEAYVIADDVVIEDVTDSVAGVTVFGPAEGVSSIPAGAWKFTGRRTRASHTEFVFPRNALAEIRANLSAARELSASIVEQRRIHARIPAVPADIGPADLPNEGGLETDAISYTKGCYLGQEVMARLKSMGQVRRRLTRVRGDGEIPTLPAPLFQNGRKVGELRSAVADDARWIGLAMLSLLQLSKTEGLAITVEGESGITLDESP